MKRFLNTKQFTMSDRQKEKTWQQIQMETHPASPAHQRIQSFRPALLLSGTVALLALVVVWQVGDRQIGEARRGVRNVREEHQVVAQLTPPKTVSSTTTSVHQPISNRLNIVEVEVVEPVKKETIRGVVRDRKTGKPIVDASVRSSEGKLLATTDQNGRFQVDSDVASSISVDMLSYAPSGKELPSGASRSGEQIVEMEPVVVEQLQAFDVEGQEYMVEVRSSVDERRLSSNSLRKYKISSVEEAMSKQSGTVYRAGEVFSRTSDGVVPDSPQSATRGSITGGTTPPNGEQVESMYFESAGVNPFVTTEEDALSTFAVDVDNASWTLARNYLSRGILPPKEAIRVEEFVNAFDADWPAQSDDAFRVHIEAGPSRFGKGYQLLRVGVVGQEVKNESRKAANLIFVVDISGSMGRENRLGLVKQSLHILLDELREGDRVGLVVYGSRGEVRLPLTGIEDREKISDAIDRLQCAGSTNAAAGLQLAYEMARLNYDSEVINRLVLCSDGVANTGASTEAGGILSIVRRASDEGITLSSIGFGMGNYNDVMMERLANDGDGNYYYVDQRAEAERVFRENLTGVLQTIAREVKIQVEFDPEHVQRWRLLGYENRDIADQDFRNDQVDAGEVGAGHQVTALYELKLTEKNSRGPFGAVRVRYESPAHDLQNAGQVHEIETAIEYDHFGASYTRGSDQMKAQALVAEFAEVLRGSYWAKDQQLVNLVPIADALANKNVDQEQMQQLAQMIRRAANIEAAKKAGTSR